MAAVPTLWWFERKSAVALCFALLRALVSGKFARLDAEPYTDDAGLMQLRFHVVLKSDPDDVGTESHEPGINESHPCPPFFPPGQTTCGSGG